MVSLKEYTKTITFKNPIKSSDTSGGNTEAYASFVTTRASATKTDGYRNIENGYDNVVEVYEFMCYWRYNLEQNISKDTRIFYDGKDFRLESWETLESGFKMMKFKASCIG